jgi:uncharacterized membrane protein
MSWSALFRVREYLKGSLWPGPVAGVILGPLLALLTHQADTSLAVPKVLQYAPSTASTVLTTIVGAMVGLTGFVVTVTVLAIQMATGTFSARYMRIWYRDPVLQATLAVLAGTLAFSFSLLPQVSGAKVPNIGVSVAGVLVVLSLVLFLLFFDRFVHRLRPVAVAALVGRLAQRTLTTLTRHVPDMASAQVTAGVPVLVVCSARDGAVQAIDARGLVRWASRHHHLLVMRAAIGDFVTSGQQLIAVFGDATPPTHASRQLRGMVALGVERTVEQDPAFALRIMVDIAVKALSAAINDPTTAVQALNHIANLLRLLGSTPLHASLTFRDSGGTARLLMPGRSWDDYLTLAVTEIREYGANSIQVNRRLRAMLEDLQQTVRPEYRAAVDTQIIKLNATVASSFADSPDQAQAEARDAQGIGGPAAATPAAAP